MGARRGAIGGRGLSAIGENGETRLALREQYCSLIAIVHDAVRCSDGSDQLSDGTVITTGSDAGELSPNGRFLSMTGFSEKTLTAWA